MVNYCCVPQCNGTGGFLFPEEKKLRKQWQVAVRRVSYKKRLWEPSVYSVVCKKHFKSTDFMETTVCGHERVKQKLKEGVIPTIFPFKTVKSDQAYQRLNRRKKRIERSEKASGNEAEKIESVKNLISDVEIDIAMEIQILDADESKIIAPSDNAMKTDEKSRSIGVQATLLTLGQLRINQGIML